MAYNEFLADRIRDVFRGMNIFYSEKKMMGGLTFMVNEKMCVGIIKESLMARIDPDVEPLALTKKGCKQMDFTGRPMKGFVLIEPDGIDMDDELAYWIDLALQFNPKAKASKKKTKQ